ncbi:substrate-binding periplasmic protein [Alkalimarinus alittae]|uniref:ABC transporter substrate-binding protein n=1 Tax=Alkalimarinus alittae TaxID=2961619 RepID=A0ABY6N2S1_9ALTE|nr:ABC transporter substrate-binding protein [Alkalimarinus alittae]UZE96410.1 ABC transporter substrate-binding protein [Alkalimarinus alittae]
MLGNRDRFKGLVVLLCWGLLAVSVSIHAKPLNVVTFIEKPLIYQKGGEPVGVVVDVVKEIFRQANIEYNLRLMPPKRALFTTAEADGYCVFPIERSQEREALFKWVSPIVISRHGLFSAPGKPISIKTLEDAKPYKLGSYLGSGVGEYLENLGFNVEYATRNELSARKLLKSRVDLWVSDIKSAKYLINSERLPITEPEIVFFTTIRAMACNLNVDPSIVKQLQKTVTQMYRNGSAEKIYGSLN